MPVSVDNAGAALDPGVVTSPVKSTQALDRSFVRGMAWTGAIKWITQILMWISTIIVARVLTPADYGIVAIASAIIGFVTMINEFGLGMAVVTKRDLVEDQISQLNSLAVLLGCAGFAVSCAAAIPLSWFFEESRLKWILWAMGISFLVGTFRTVPSALLERELKFKLLAIMEGGQAILASVCVVALALGGFGYWALVGGIMVGTIAWTLLTLAYRTQPFKWPVPRSLTEVIAFSWHLIVMRLCWYISTNIDRFIVGKVLGQAAVGSYAFACTLAYIPMEKVGGLVNRVTPAFFSAMREDHASIRKYILRLTEGLSLVVFPMAFGMALVADDFVLLLLGEQWGDVIIPLRILACYGAVRSLVALLAPTLLVTGLSRLGMLNGIWLVVVLVPAFYIGSAWGIVGVALSWVAAQPLTVIPLYAKLFRRIDLPFVSFAKALWPAVNGCLMMALAVLAVNHILPEQASLVVRLVSVSASGALVYLGIVWCLYRTRIVAFMDLVRAERG